MHEKCIGTNGKEEENGRDSESCDTYKKYKLRKQRNAHLLLFLSGSTLQSTTAIVPR